jgi:hypothetical protein
VPPLKEPQFAPPVDPRVDVTRKKVAGVSQPEDRHLTKSVSRDDPFLLDGDFLLVTNETQNTYSFRWARKHYIVEPGSSKHVIFEALVDALGDPRSMDNEVVTYNDGNGSQGIIMERHSEISRLFGKYAVENESLDDLVSKTPDVTVTTLNGDKVIFPGLRPDMLPFPNPGNDGGVKVNTDTTQMFDRLAAENEEMREQLRVTNERMDAVLASKAGVDTSEV